MLGGDLPSTGMVVYSVFVRQFGEEGTFAEVKKDLDRIVELGVTHIWLLPIHPIGQVKRKGSLGSPYAISDYRGINPEYGTMEEFKELLEEAHERDLRVLIDCVYNHTSPDSVLAKEHPEWFYTDAAGKLCTRFEEWSDVVDLKYYSSKQIRNPGLWEYLIDCLLFWLEMGVDGFRCDVAATIPLEFWVEARKKVKEALPSRKTMWIAESFGPAMIRACRRRGIPVSCDPALFKAFDIIYDYDTHKVASACYLEREDLGFLFDVLRFQEATGEPSFTRLRFVENHDQPRIHSLTRSTASAHAWMCMTAFLKGALLLYQGIESSETNQNSLFEKDPVKWGEYEDSALVQDVCALKSQLVVIRGTTTYISATPIACIIRSIGNEHLIGVFDTYGLGGGEQEVPVPDGIYDNLLGNREIQVSDGCASAEDLPYSAAVFRYHGALDIAEMDSRLE